MLVCVCVCYLVVSLLLSHDKCKLFCFIITDKTGIADSEQSSDAESRIDTLVEQKIQEILQKVKSNGGNLYK